MTTITLFKPGKWSHNIDIPTTWNELTTPELELIAKALQDNGARQNLLLSLISGRAKRQGIRLQRGWQQLLDLENATIDGLPLVDELLKENNRTINPYPILASFYGPESNFGNLTVGEYEDAEVMSSLYHKEQNTKRLATIVAILWRPLNKKTRKRTAYAGVGANSKSFSRRVSNEKLHAIHLWYIGCRAQLVKTFPEVFSGGNGNVDSEPDLTAFTRVIHAGAGVKNGTRAEVRALLLKEFLFDCQLAAEQAAEMEAEMKKR